MLFLGSEALEQKRAGKCAFLIKCQFAPSQNVLTKLTLKNRDPIALFYITQGRFRDIFVLHKTLEAVQSVRNFNTFLCNFVKLYDLRLS